METENAQKSGKIKALIIILAVVILILVWWLGGFRSVMTSISYIFYILIAVIFIGLVSYIVYYIKFKENKVDITWLNKQKLIQSALRCKNPYLKNLYLSGDGGHSSVKLGRIEGYTQIKCYKGNKLMKDEFDGLSPQIQQKLLGSYAKGKDVRCNDRGVMQYNMVVGHSDKGEIKRWVDIEIPEPEDVFLVKNGGFFSRLFSEYTVIRVSPFDHTELLGDVSLKGISLVKISEYFYLNKDYLDIHKVDYTLLQEAKRGITFLAFADMHQLIQSSMGLDARHKKWMEKEGLMKDPTSSVIQPPAT